MIKEKSIQDLQAIRNIMEDSTRFLSLSGLSGIFPGIFALLGAGYIYIVVMASGDAYYDEHFRSLSNAPTSYVRMQLIVTALLVLLAALSSAWYFSWRKAKKAGKKLWSKTFQKLLFNLLLPVLIGGIFSLLLIYHNQASLIASAMLIFYGLALTNAGKFTFKEVQYLGLCEIALGIFAGIFIHYGIVFWALGFGVLHIVYGTAMYIRHN